MAKRTRNTKTETIENTEQAAIPESRAQHLVVIRESAMYDGGLIEGMAQQTLTKVAHLPGATELRAAGLDVFEHPERWHSQVRRIGKSRMVLIEIEDVLYLYYAGSAAKRDDDADTNAFTTELLRLICEHRPEVVWAAAFTRLLRSATMGGVLLDALTRHTRRLECEARIDLATPEGQIMFQVLAMISAAERNYIVARHTTGRVFRYQQGDWIPSMGYPMGYRLDGRKLVVSETQVDAVRKALVVLADLSLNARQVADRLGELGITTPMLQALHGDDATVADARHSSGVVESLAGWVDAMEQGIYETLWPNQFAGVEHINGLQVEQHPDYQYGLFRFEQTLPLPEGGWADAETFDRIRQRLALPSLGGGTTHRTSSPLSGLFAFDDDANEYVMMSPNLTRYAFLRRSLNAERKFAGWKSDLGSDGEFVAAVDRGEFHRSIVDAIIEQVRRGLPASLDEGRFVVSDTRTADSTFSRIRSLKRQVDAAHGRLERARRNARLAEDGSAAQLFVDDVVRSQADIARFERELDELEASRSKPQLGMAFDTNVDMVVHAIGALAHAGNHAPADLRSALQTVLRDTRWHVNGDQLCWELSLELPHTDGTVVLGPIRGHVHCNVASARRPTSSRRTRERTRTDLVALGYTEKAAGAAAQCPHPELFEVLRAHRTGEPLPPEVDTTWAQHIASVYDDPAFNWPSRTWALSYDIRQRVLNAFEGRPRRRAELVAAGFTPQQLHYLARTLDTPTGAPIIEIVKKGRDPLYSPITCPHCGGFALHSIATPETRPGVLCATCWRAPFAGSPVFPEWYRTTNAGAVPDTSSGTPAGAERPASH